MILKLVSRKMKLKFKLIFVTNVVHKNIDLMSAISKHTIFLLQNVSYVWNKVTCQKTAEKTKMEYSTKEEVATFVVRTLIKRQTVQIVQRVPKNTNTTSNKTNFNFKMDFKFSKKKLGIIHPLMEIKPFAQEKQFLEERFILKGEQKDLFKK